MICALCKGPIPSGARRDSVYCSKRCRQAAWRFARDVGDPARLRDTPMRLAYADPPYPGLSKRYYGDHPDFAGEVDHAELIRRLSIDFDGWALSTNASSLQALLALCPPDVRVAAWHRGGRHVRSLGPAITWEPVIFRGGRLGVDRPDDPEVTTWHTRRVDSLVHISRPRLTDASRVVGAKPAAFARWMFDLLGALPDDDFTDLYPGSGGILRAWQLYSKGTSHVSGRRG